VLRLEKITEKNVWRLIELEVDESQKNLVATNTQSLIEAYITVSEGGVALPFGIYDGEKPVGFLMIGYGGEEGENVPDIEKVSYCLWRLMIDKSCQHRGYGREAVRLALEYMRTKPVGEAEYCYLSYEPENSVAKELYASFGFEETGELDEEELVARLKL